jgi:amidase
MKKIKQSFLKFISAITFLVPTLIYAGDQDKSFNILDASITELQQKLDSGGLTSVQLVDKYLERIAAYDQKGPTLNAITVINPKAKDRALKLDQERVKQGARGPLHGIPILVKDNYETADMQTGIGALIFAGWLPPEDSVIVKRLRDAGAIILGKTNMHEFAMGFATHGSLFGQTRNPYALGYIPGGSSGGTGAAIAANFATAGFGSDTCGSIRMPSAHNALVGLRSSVGLTSRRGIFPLSHIWDVGGPMTHNVSDLAVIYDAIAGYDPGDAQTAASVGHVPETYTTSLNKDGLQNKRIGVLTNLLVVDPEDEEVAAIIRSALESIKTAGAEVVDIHITGLTELMHDDFGGMYSILADIRTDINAYLKVHPTAPVASVADILKSDLLKDSELRRNFQTAMDFKPGSTQEYLSLHAKREPIKQAVLVAMAEARVESLVYPTLRRKAVRIGEEQYGSNCHLTGHTGFPAITVPAGFSEDGLPIGIEFMAREWQEPLLIELAYAFEQATRHRQLPLTTPGL